MYLEEEIPSGEAPHTDPHAKPNKFDIASPNRQHVRVTNACYRLSVFTGVFIVADSKDPHSRNKEGHETLEVECTWYGWRPKTRWIRITLPNAPEYLENYSGDVTVNLGR